MKKNLIDERYYLSEYRSFVVNESPCLSHPRALERIKDGLQPLSERCSAIGYQENYVDGHAMSELAGDLRDAMIEYQVGLSPPVSYGVFYLGVVQFAQQKSLYDQNCRLIVRAWLFCSALRKMLKICSRRQVSRVSTIDRRILTS